MTRIISIIIIIILISLPVLGQNNEDVLDMILNDVGFTRADLGYQPKGYWNRFPLDIPYRLTSFDDLFAEPLKLYDFSKVMSNTVEYYLDPKYTDSASDGLYKLVYNLGVDKKLGGFRSYSANLVSLSDSTDPLGEAIGKLYTIADQKTESYSFGSKAEEPNYKNEINTKCEVLPDTVKYIIADLILNLAEAIHWRNLAFRNCNRADMETAIRIRDLASTQGDGMKYYPELDDIASAIDYPSLHYAALKVAAVSENTAVRLKPFIGRIPKDFQMEMTTPFGKIAIFSPEYKKDKLPQTKTSFRNRAKLPGWFEYDADNTLFVLDFGRNMIYQGSAGATSSLSNPVSVVIDMGGDDYYGHEQNEFPPNAGVGLMGIGLVLDIKGNDHYNGSVYSQGAGLFGVGVLCDLQGDDNYNASTSAQGCGYFGIGLCFDGVGDDEFYIHGDGQGMGGIGGGVGVLASYDGHDKYTAEPYADVFNRADYHSQFKINGNTAQGAGFGRRGDGSDGHAWAGGLGAIIDIHGNDLYYSGNWTLGVGYWFGTGIAIDRFGDDTYKSCYFTQGSGAHFCNGILIDEGGNDRHELYETAGAALGFGWDYTNAFLINKGGDDIYRAKMISMGLAQIRSCAFLIDIGGNDTYYLGDNTPGLGEASYQTNFDNISNLTPYYYYAKSFGGFIDIQGDDRYYQFNDTGETIHSLFKNNSQWWQPDKTDSTYGADNYGVGIDLESGTIDELFKWDNK